jgi:protein gp37
VSQNSAIEWTDATWNPVRGCSRVSEGCRHCYAEGVAARFSGPGRPYEGLARFTPGGPKWTGVIRLVPEVLEEPLRWKRPRRVFVNSMSDLFHEDVPDDFIDDVFGVMALAKRHTFQVLTMRAGRMRRFFDRAPDRAALPNVWLGVSVEDQRAAADRIPHLIDTPAATRFVSAEPLLGPVDLTNIEVVAPEPPNGPGVWLDALRGHVKGPGDMLGVRIAWVIAGGESGRGARPCSVGWVRSLVGQCRSAAVPVFVKQLGAHWATDNTALGDAKGGDPQEWPEDLRVRQWPEARP